MDKNTISGIALIFLIFIFFSWWNAPTEAEKAQMTHKQDSIAQVIKTQRIVDSVRKITQAKMLSNAKPEVNTPDLKQSVAGIIHKS